MKASSVLMKWISFCALQHVESWTRMLAARCNLMYLVCVYVFVSVCLWNLGHHQCWEIHFTWVEGDLCRDFNYKENCDQWCKLSKQHKTSWRRLHKTCVMGRKDHMFKHDWSQFFLLLPEIMTEQIHKADFDMVFGHRDLRRSYLYLYCQEQMDVVGESVRQLITATYDEGKESDTFWVILTRVWPQCLVVFVLGFYPTVGADKLSG